MTQITITCHDCGETFATDAGNEHGLYEFTRCPNCGSAATTLARE